MLDTPAPAPILAGVQAALEADVYEALKLPPGSRLRCWLHPLFRPAFERFARIGLAFDAQTAAEGFCAAAGRLVPTFAKHVHIAGAATLPAAGPLLVASNHPGGFDSVYVFSCLPRQDLMVVTSDMAFLKALPNVARHINVVTLEDIPARMLALRRCLRHLQAGGCVHIFPSGEVDPDPAMQPGSGEALETWSGSLEFFLRLVPGLRVSLAIVSGVFSPLFMRLPIARPGGTRKDHQLTVEILQSISQLLLPGGFPAHPRLSFAPPVTIGELQAGEGGLRAALLGRANDLLQAHQSAAALPAGG